ncbi:MAG: leucine-rich repeat protein, partial [Muribaculaceae bacterium]|nr:leucine-rich repeat protein [Muribaculaceae bacterium]
DAFYGCSSLSSFWVDGDNFTYRSNNGILFSADGKELLQFPANHYAEELFIPYGTEVIMDVAFAKALNLKNITLPNTVTEIKFLAFMGCENLESITLPKSLKTIGVMAFDSCDKLEAVYYRGFEEEWYNIEILERNQALQNAIIYYKDEFVDIPEGAIEFNGHYYKVYYDIDIGWHDAELVCESLGGHLATLTTQEESEFVYNLASQAGIECWLGATDELCEGEWLWITGESWEYSNAEFDNCNNQQHYLVMNYYSNAVWDDQSEKTGSNCTTGGYVCEWE